MPHFQSSVHKQVLLHAHHFDSPKEMSQNPEKSPKYPASSKHCINVDRAELICMIPDKLDYEYPPGILSDYSQSDLSTEIQVTRARCCNLMLPSETTALCISKVKAQNTKTSTKRFTVPQLELLESHFAKTDLRIISRVLVKQLAQQCNLKERQIRKWFCNRKYRLKVKASKN